MSNNQVAIASPKTLMDFMEKHKQQVSLALPKHITADRMIRLALTSFSQNKTLQKCDIKSIFSSVVVASQLGLEIGVGGQGYLVPYFDKKEGQHKAQFIPGWRGLVDLVSRSGRATVWTGAVFAGDKFEWALGDNPFVRHQPEGDNDNWKDITHVYAIGRVNGSQYPVIEVWSMDRIVRHLNKYNKVGAQHYAVVNDGQNMEMYSRKVVLLQVLKYMPQSIEVQKAMDVANAVDSGKSFTMDGDIVIINETDSDDESQSSQDVKPEEVRDGMYEIIKTECEKGTAAYRAYWQTMNRAEQQKMREFTQEFQDLAAHADITLKKAEEDKHIVDAEYIAPSAEPTQEEKHATARNKLRAARDSAKVVPSESAQHGLPGTDAEGEYTPE